MKTERTAFPKTGDLVSVIKFLCEVPAARRDCVYVGGVHLQPGMFNFCLFPCPVSASKEQTEILKAITAVTKFAAPIVTGDLANAS